MNIISKYEHLIKRTQAELDFFKIKAEYEDTIQSLENLIKGLCHELHRQLDRNCNILLSNDCCGSVARNGITDRDRILNECKQAEEIFRNLKCQLDKFMGNNVILEKVLENAKCLVNDRLNREKMALEKVQEALTIAECAIVEKEDALNREKAIREECNQLATTIGQVMEDAAQKVERNVNDIKKQYERQIKHLIHTQNELKKQIELHKGQIDTAEKRNMILEQKLREMIHRNSNLDTDLQVASQAIVEMELKLKAIENLLDQDQRTNRISEEIQQEIRDFLLNNKQIKERWRFAIEDVTLKLRNEIKNLQKENTSYKAEIQNLRIKLLNKNK
ncbi:unnamed protein product [Hermetia illucens]|uniref:Uncharacterized protein n=2 Tax=Hermetia illucens TaxID=343691 RepID=A0A7R8YTL5_HERIL|nr:unnamed protein product [Hermetia illucens]